MKSDLSLLQSILHPHAHRVPPRLRYAGHQLGTIENHRSYTVTACKRERRCWQELPKRVIPTYHDSQKTDLVSLRWPAPPRNILLVKKESAPVATEALKEFAVHLHDVFPSTNVLLEPRTANEVHADLPFPTYSGDIDTWSTQDFHGKVDLTVTFGGDGTILHASSLFASSDIVPPMLSFSMGTLGFLGEWKFAEYKRAFREVFMSGAAPETRNGVLEPLVPTETTEGGSGLTGWSSIRGKSMGSSRAARVLMRNRLKISMFAADGTPLSSGGVGNSSQQHLHAMNELIIHRGRDPHLAVVEVFVGGRFLTEAVGDGMIVSTPTGSTAYSLSSGGSIIHPLVSSILLTPVCPRSLSFRPLVLPAGTPITLKLSNKNRGRELEVSIDGVRRSEAMGVGMEVRVTGEEIKRSEGSWHGGVPCIVRRGGPAGEGDDGWVGGLNLLKFNYPFGEES